LRNKYALEIRWIVFPLHPDTPIDGLTLNELFAGRKDITQMFARWKQAADEAELAFGDRKKTYNSRPAQEMGKWAESLGKGKEFRDTVFRAYFVDGKNIATIPIMVELAESLGLPGKEARKVLETRPFREAVDLDWVRSRSMCVTAVPTFVFNRRALIGAQPYEALEQLIKANDVTRCSPHL